LQVQEVVLRALFEGVALKLPQGDTVPLTPFGRYFFNVTPVQVQEVVLRAFFEGVALKLPQGDTVPLTPFGGYFLM
jgi:nucleoid DNA-binding protein